MVKCFLSPTLRRDPCLLCTFTPTNVLQLLVGSTFTTLKHFHLGALTTHGVSECVWLWTFSSGFASQLCRRSSEDRRPLGQLQNNESLKSFPILLRVGTLPPSPDLASSHSFTLPPANWHRKVMSADQLLPQELLLGNRGKRVKPAENVRKGREASDKKKKNQSDYFNWSSDYFTVG